MIIQGQLGILINKQGQLLVDNTYKQTQQGKLVYLMFH